MPLFATHMAAAGAVSLIGAFIGRAKARLDWTFLIMAVPVGLIGGMLPDLDAPGSRPVRIVIPLLGLVLAIGIVQWLKNSSRVLGITWTRLRAVLAGAGIMILIYMAGPLILEILTHHRGMMHSVPMALAYGAGVALIFSGSGRKPAFWLGAIGLAGFGSHLFLDACTSYSLLPFKIFSKSIWSTTLIWGLVFILMTLIMYTQNRTKR
ncbi:MAG: metal-dependent hydrolase [Deltaproteobacteria bacterium]|nr:metal-dependent hydrolase [Deltaproteobacteria bacterium]